jgi:hypothetical protein
MSKCRLTGALVIFGLLAFVCTASAAPPTAGASRHCVVNLLPSETDATQLVASAPECYPTFRDAIFFATKGIILLSSKEPFSAQLDILDQEQKARKDDLVANSTFVIAIDYEHINYGGSSIIWQHTAQCDPTGGFAAASMPSGWDNRLSSTRGYSGCDKNVLWEHQNWTGSKLTCFPNCSSVGSMNDKTSSREWHNTCEGVAGQWQGCRGTGCSVCAELVANYPCYFQNHPNCSSNSLCGGLYFTCSDACPAPTQADTCSTPCNATASCANAGGGSAFCSGSNNSCFAVDDCYATCDGSYYYCPNPPGICPL